MKRITFVIGGMTRGGAERVISILANQYVSLGWKVDIVMLLLDKVEYKLDKNIRLINMTCKKNKRFFQILRWLDSFRKYVVKSEPDIIVSFVARINLIVLFSTIGINRKIVISERNDPAMDGRSVIVDFATKVLYKRATRIIFQTERALNYFPKELQKNGVIIPNPISVQAEALLQCNHKIVSVGRLAPQKNQKMLIDAFSEVSRKYPEYTLWIYGEGELREELEQEIQNKNLQSRVFLPGNTPNIHESIADAEIFVLSSDYEGLSNALLEAMMMGLPCISTDCAGSDEYIRNGDNGILVPVGDTVKIAEAMIMFIEDKELREKIGKRGKETVKKCERDFVMEQWKNAIEN